MSAKTKTHTIPLFEGAKSRRHHQVPVWRLSLQAMLDRARHGSRFERVDTFAQFVGFPRSGHSLVGSIVDAHPEAIISHELDTMGLIEHGLTEKSVFALIARNSSEFSKHGRYWNGFSYVVPGQLNGSAKKIRVIGDKKGDWAARRVGKDPELLETARRRISSRCKWILVVRHPLDNIATMSLRRGRVYDKLRIESQGSGAFREALKAAQAKGEIAPEALDAMIDDYEGLCRSIELMKSRIDPQDWHEVHYEAFSAEAQSGIRALLEFLDLKQYDTFIRDAASLVRPSARQSRNDLAWRPEQTERIRGMMTQFSFLQRYLSDEQSPAATGVR